MFTSDYQVIRHGSVSSLTNLEINRPQQKNRQVAFLQVAFLAVAFDLLRLIPAPALPGSGADGRRRSPAALSAWLTQAPARSVAFGC
jgi:hypothetical protein